MRILIAPDKFKGSLSAAAVAAAIGRGVKAACEDAVCDLLPIADGGEGFAETLATAIDAEWIEIVSVDAIGRSIDARYAWKDGTAILEMSEASGLWRLTPVERAPLEATTYGTGLLLKDAIERGAEKVIIGLGGSATTDGGCGAALALGFTFFSGDNHMIEGRPHEMMMVDRIELPKDLKLPEIVAACDVTNPLLGERGSAAVYGPQKGADPTMVDMLDAGLENLADVVKSQFGGDYRDVVGAGAAGGLGFGLLAFCKATIRPGLDVIAEILRLEERIAQADLVITGEGRLDDQTLDGKGPVRVAALARKYGKPVIAIGGSATAEVLQSELFDHVFTVMEIATSLEEAMGRAEVLLEKLAADALQIMRSAKQDVE